MVNLFERREILLPGILTQRGSYELLVASVPERVGRALRLLSVFFPPSLSLKFPPKTAFVLVPAANPIAVPRDETSCITSHVIYRLASRIWEQHTHHFQYSRTDTDVFSLVSRLGRSMLIAQTHTHTHNTQSQKHNTSHR